MKRFIQYEYDLSGQRKTLIEPGGGRFTCVYDPLGRLSRLENPQSQRTTFIYDDTNRRTVKFLASGARTSYVYDNANNQLRVANIRSASTTISSFDYRYDKIANRTAMIEGDGARTTYSYDFTSQLLGEHRTGSSSYRNTYIYDNAANRTLKNESGTRTTVTYDAANQVRYELTGSGRTTYTFDASGNQALTLSPTLQRTTTTWDYENKTRLVRLHSGVRNTMLWEPDGLRVQVENSQGTSQFVYDGQAFLCEANGSGVIQATFSNEPSVYTDAISQRRGSTTSYYHHDALGSTRQLTDASQAITDEYLSNAWGVPLTATGGTTNWLRFVGRYGYWFEIDTGNYNIGQRTYRPVIARWTSVDPAGFSDGLNHYILIGVPNTIDPSGMLILDVSCASDPCCAGNKASLEATDLFYHSSRIISPSTKEEANGVGIAIYFRNEMPCCSGMEFIQFMMLSVPRQPAANKVMIDSCSATPYYGQNPGTSPDYGNNPVPGGFPGAGELVNTVISMYDRPYRGTLLSYFQDQEFSGGRRTGQMSLIFTTCAVCRRAEGDMILSPCVLWGYTYTLKPTPPYTVAQMLALNDITAREVYPLQHVEPFGPWQGGVDDKVMAALSGGTWGPNANDRDCPPPAPFKFRKCGK